MSEDRIVLRPARQGDGQSVFDLTWVSVKALAKDHYSAELIANWMGERTPAFYEKLANGLMVVAEQGGAIVGFVDAEPGELTRLSFSQMHLEGGLADTYCRSASSKPDEGTRGQSKWKLP